MADPIAEVRGISDAQVEKLKTESITTTDKLLERAGSAADRRALATATGIDGKDLLELVNRADLARINGVGRQYANLLEDAGVDSVPELANRNADNLFAALEKAAAGSGIQRPPTLANVQDWIKQAKELPRAVSH